MKKLTLEQITELKSDSVWTYRDVAEFLKCSESNVRNMVHTGKIPYRKFGRKVIFSELAIRRLILGDGII